MLFRGPAQKKTTNFTKNAAIRPTDEGFPIVTITHIPIVFLGGTSKRASSSWRDVFFTHLQGLPVQVIDPTPSAYPDPNHDPQEHYELVQWQRAAIQASSIAVFWLDEKLANQAARVEIGYAIALGKNVLIGAGPGFLGKKHLELFANQIIAETVTDLKDRLVTALHNFTASKVAAHNQN